MIYIDTETTGLHPQKDRVTLFQYCTDTDPFVHLIQNPDLTAVHALLDSHDTIVGQNLAFDFAMLRYLPKSIEHFEDTLYLDRLGNFKEEGHSLDLITARLLHYDPYEGLDKKRLQRTNWATATLSDEQRRYATLDVAVLPLIYDKLKQHTRRSVYRFDKMSILTGLRVQRHGLPIRTEEAIEELETQESLLHRLLSMLSFNPNSPKQVCEALHITSSADRELAELAASGNTVAAQVREARQCAKYINFLKKLTAEPRYYGTLQPAAKSGRFTSKKENIQNLPRDTKRFIGTDTHVIVSADFAQLELRTIAAIANDSTMIELFVNGEDLHDYSAEQLFGPSFTKEQRTVAKVFNFATLYGAGAGTIEQMLLAMTGIKLSTAEVKRLRSKWLGTYTGIAQWQRQGATRHEMGLTHQTPHGRPYTSKMMTDMLNIENQGAGAEVARIALHRIDANLPDGANLINFIHDSYIVESVNDAAVYSKAAQVIHEAMTYAWERAPFEKHGIPMPVEVGVAHNLKDADSLENCVLVYKGD